jgi:hypothetical protein
MDAMQPSKEKYRTWKKTKRRTEPPLPISPERKQGTLDKGHTKADSREESRQGSAASSRWPPPPRSNLHTHKIKPVSSYTA